MKPGIRATLLTTTGVVVGLAYAVYDQNGASRPELTPALFSETPRQDRHGSDGPVPLTRPAEVVLQGGVSTGSIDPNRFIDPDSNYYTGNGEIVHVGKFRDPAMIEVTSEPTVVIEVGEFAPPNDSMRLTLGACLRMSSAPRMLTPQSSLEP